MQSGTFNFKIDRNVHPTAFTPGVRCRWSTFQIGDDRCCIISDGPDLVGLLNAHLPNPRRLFQISFTPDRTRRHLVTIGWSRGKMKFYLDAKLVAEVPLAEKEDGK